MNAQSIELLTEESRYAFHAATRYEKLEPHKPTERSGSLVVTFEAGTKLGHYEVVCSLGAGGMGEVYRAKDTKLGREVAI